MLGFIEKKDTQARGGEGGGVYMQAFSAVVSDPLAQYHGPPANIALPLMVEL